MPGEDGTDDFIVEEGSNGTPSDLNFKAAHPKQAASIGHDAVDKLLDARRHILVVCGELAGLIDGQTFQRVVEEILATLDAVLAALALCNEENMAFIEEARLLLPRLADEVERLTRERDDALARARQAETWLDELRDLGVRQRLAGRAAKGEG